MNSKTAADSHFFNDEQDLMALSDWRYLTDWVAMRLRMWLSERIRADRASIVCCGRKSSLRRVDRECDRLEVHGLIFREFSFQTERVEIEEENFL
jgi:hypothetical protein